MATKHKGYTPEEVAAKEKIDLEAIFKDLEKDRNEINEAAIALAKKDATRQVHLIEYRIKSTNRVLEFIRMGVERLDPNTINRLLTHCMNKLNGNIDGIECTLEYDKETHKKG